MGKSSGTVIGFSVVEPVEGFKLGSTSFIELCGVVVVVVVVVHASVLRWDFITGSTSDFTIWDLGFEVNLVFFSVKLSVGSDDCVRTADESKIKYHSSKQLYETFVKMQSKIQFYTYFDYQRTFFVKIVDSQKDYKEARNEWLNHFYLNEELS